MTLIKSDAVSNPANVEVCEFHSGAETMSTLEIEVCGWVLFCIRQCNAFLTRRLVSKRINRKLTGRAS
jgi:hypothetical protein